MLTHVNPLWVGEPKPNRTQTPQPRQLTLACLNATRDKISHRRQRTVHCCLSTHVTSLHRHICACYDCHNGLPRVRLHTLAGISTQRRFAHHTASKARSTVYTHCQLCYSRAGIYPGMPQARTTRQPCHKTNTAQPSTNINSNRSDPP